MAVFYTSDQHFGHRMVAELRGFDSVPDHDAALVAAWREAVRPDDMVWVLGDIAMNAEHGLTTMAELPGRKLLIAGNHDAVHPMHRDAWRRQRRWLEVFEAVMPFARRKVGGVQFLMSHFPYGALDRGATRYAEYRLRDEGLPLVHGHLHTADRATGPRMVHVGVDAWGLSPVREDAVQDALAYANLSPALPVVVADTINK